MGDEASCFSVLTSLLRDIGFTGIMYVGLDRSKGGEPKPSSLTDVNPEFLRRYRAMRLFLHDPMMARALTTTAPFLWTNLPGWEEGDSRRTGPAMAGMAAARLAREFGYMNGFNIPCHSFDASGFVHSAVMWLGWGASSPLDNPELCPSWLRILAIVFHERIVAIRSNGDAKHITPDLTDRERDVLMWAARGKTIEETAIILSVADDTVKFHMRRAAQKLNAANKVHAVSLAIINGLIIP